ncbi:sulfotransferase domain-containing protein [Rhizorhabdus dicambivorans]|uniref:Sulfotransferase n=1 Tax=Rhizorhabdus dicambivorans TaxID=1850238 RepID=A0A2A4FPY8_9SPHN|nr:sulfotransferase domain-containing protein [Rhizorhabdus dicambivorans]ATE64044.1 sulfotransferase [Rhizorhabdus dicambivorans]PCE40237.1 sulfotransferase [Rhizorhabdus dicambivorans]
MSGDAQVSFLVAGVQKGGTSALFEYLRDLAGVQMPAVKEAHFFDDETVDWSAPDYRRYHALFADDARLRGEATPIYIYWPNSLERIARYNPAMRIILLFRDPIERAWSHWKMEYAKRKETHPFAWCIREGRARLADADLSAPGYHRVFSYVERGFYGQQVERLFGLFPHEQCLLLRSEELDTDPTGTIDRICTFLRIPGPGTVPSRTVHAARTMAYPSVLTDEDRRLLADLYRSDLARFEDVGGLDTSFWTRNWL